MAFQSAQIGIQSSIIAAHRKAEDELHRGIEREVTHCDEASRVCAERRSEDRDQQVRCRIENVRLPMEGGRARNKAIEPQQPAKAREAVGRNADLSHAIERRGCRRTTGRILVDVGIDSAASDETPSLEGKLPRYDAESTPDDHGLVVPQSGGRIGPSEPERSQSAVDFGTRLRHERSAQTMHLCADLNSARSSSQAKSPNDELSHA